MGIKFVLQVESPAGVQSDIFRLLGKLLKSNDLLIYRVISSLQIPKAHLSIPVLVDCSFPK